MFREVPTAQMGKEDMMTGGHSLCLLSLACKQVVLVTWRTEVVERGRAEPYISKDMALGEVGGVVTELVS